MSIGLYLCQRITSRAKGCIAMKKAGCSNGVDPEYIVFGARGGGESGG